jgi:hypothetical protein
MPEDPASGKYRFSTRDGRFRAAEDKEVGKDAGGGEAPTMKDSVLTKGEVDDWWKGRRIVS